MDKQVTPNGRRLAWRPDAPDQRDHLFRAVRAARLPKKVDLRDKCRSVKNQDTLGSCTGWATAAYADMLYPRKPSVSPLFIYYNNRVFEGTVNEDAGAQIRTSIKVLAKVGAAKNTLCPYEIERFKRKPSKEAYDYAAKHRITSYSRVQSLAGIKASLADGFPVVFGMMLYDAFDDEPVAATGIVPMPRRGEAVLGGHAVLIVGYDDTKRCVIVRNSWGKNWGDKGYFYLPYAYVENNDWCSDFWTIRK